MCVYIIQSRGEGEEATTTRYPPVYFNFLFTFTLYQLPQSLFCLDHIDLSFLCPCLLPMWIACIIADLSLYDIAQHA